MGYCLTQKQNVEWTIKFLIQCADNLKEAFKETDIGWQRSQILNIFEQFNGGIRHYIEQSIELEKES